jgi:hypothetical protein
MLTEERLKVSSPSEQLIQMMWGFAFSQALYVAAELGLADQLAAGPRTSTELAIVTGAHAPALYRVMRTLASLGVFKEDADQRFSLAPFGETLRSDAPDSVRDFVIVQGRPMSWRPFGELLGSVRTGQTGVERAFGVDFGQYLMQHPDDLAVLGRSMISLHGQEAAAVASAYDLAGARTLVDVGGGLGNLLTALLEANPTLRGVLLDLYAADEAARRLRAAGLAERSEVIAGDFFTSVPSGGDVYLLSHVVHDWNDTQCHSLLSNCRGAMAADGRLLIVEMVLPGPNQPSPGRVLDLVMLTVGPGKERTEREYHELLAKAGFRLTRIVPTDSPVSIIEAVPA